MKLQHIIPAALLLAALSGCEERIDNRYVEVPDPEPYRMVLIEEYTGVDCKNCPTGHAQLKAIEQQFNTEANLAAGVGVISVGIHIPAFGDDVADGGFVTPEASALADNQNTAPAARINRATAAVELDRWLGLVSVQIGVRPQLTFEPVSAEIVDNAVRISGAAFSRDGISDATLHVWIVEDDIENWQLMPDGKYDEHYLHHGVYRASATGLRGQTIELKRNQTAEFHLAPFPVHANWNLDNLRVVAFVTDGPDGKVLNATQAPIVKQ